MNLLESTRSKHEDLDRFQRIIREQLDFTPKNFRDSVQQSHVINAYLDKICQTKDELVKIYEDSDNARKDELQSIMGSGPQVYSVFYDKVKDIRNYYRQFPNLEAERSEDRAYFDVSVPPFTGEESYGRYLDLNESFQNFLNLKENTQGRKIDYYSYMDSFYRFPSLNEHSLRSYTVEYKKYLEALLQYLVSFMQRSQPLMELEPFLKESDEIFQNQWKDLQSSDSPPARDNNPLYCKPCQKLFPKETVFTGHLKGKKHLKAAESQESHKGDILSLESKISRICKKLLQETIDSSKVHIEKKIARNYADNDEEDEVEEEFVEKVEEEEVEIQTSKQNYPVGWDGKPIPYWLYKLHGLGVEYKCEICGNASYFGRKAYEMHFQEWRHAHGMKCLGIPNNLIFRDITKINDALQLWEKIKRDGINKEWKPEIEEEFEDKEGNVFNKKVFLDLKRQGLL